MPFSLKNYSSLEPLGIGGTSEIYRAIQLSDSKRVVIKKIGSELAEQSAIIRQFETQSESVRKLTHENIIRIFNHGCENGYYYLSMEYVDGMDLERFIDSDFFTLDLGLMVVYQALQGLLFAHRHGVAHCDIKPGNILIAKNGTVKLTDFGIARSHLVLQQNEQINTIFATPLYMSPEQAATIRKQDLATEVWAETNSLGVGDTSHPSVTGLNEVIPWDTWSVGVLLYRICTKRMPFGGKTLSDLTDAITAKKEPALAPPLYKGPSSIGALVHACLEKDPAKRLSSLQPLLTALEGYFSTLPEPNPEKALNRCFASPHPKTSVIKKPVPAPPTVKIPKAIVPLPAWDFRKRAKPALLAGAGAMLVVSVIIAIVLSGRPKEQQEVQPDTPSQPEIALAATPHEETPDSVPSGATAPADTASTPVVAPPETTVTEPLIKEVPVPPPAEKPRKTREKVQAREDQKTSPVAKTTTAPKAEQNRSGTLFLSVDPPRANAYIDGALLTGSELKKGKQLDAGNHVLAIQLTGFEPHSQSITISAGAKQTLAINLTAVEKGYGLLHIYSYPWSQIYIDRTITGTAPTPSPVSLLEGQHFLELRRNGYVAHQEWIEISKGQTTRIQVDLEKAEDSPETPAVDSNRSGTGSE